MKKTILSRFLAPRFGLLPFSLAGAAFAWVLLGHARRAEACGCFVPPDPSVPIVQAGERILFSSKNGQVEAHIQVQYSGPAEEFGWLLPMPSVPQTRLGTDELFAQLTAQTQPVYRMDAKYVGNCPFDPGGFGGSPSSASDNEGVGRGGVDGGSPLVLRESVGDFDVAVLRADSKDAMFKWLADNNFFVPAGTEDVSDPYIRPNAYFLALKLRKGADVGDIQPVVVTYESDRPMIPIILTSVAADPNMGVQVWVAGDHRAIPVNFFHTKINDAAIDWPSFGSNYVDVINDAVDEAQGHHSFVTEYAGSSSVMVDILDPQWRFGNLAELANITDPIEYVEYLNWNGYPVQSANRGFFAPTYSSQMLNLLQEQLPVPQAMLPQGVTANDFYVSIRSYLTAEQAQELYEAFDPELLTAKLKERVVDPTRHAGQVFRDNRYLSRLFTTLSPHEMVKDPVFSFNPDLPDVSNVHSGEITYYCNLVSNPTQGTTPAKVVTENGFKILYPDGTGVDPFDPNAVVQDPELPVMPWSQTIEILREEGPPQIVVDNTDEISSALDRGDGGCAAGGGGALASLWAMAMGALARRRRRALLE